MKSTNAPYSSRIYAGIWRLTTVEIGVFDIDPDNGDEICVGAGVLTQPLTGGAFLEIIASMDDGLGTTNGFQPGNEMIFRLYTPADIGLHTGEDKTGC